MEKSCKKSVISITQDLFCFTKKNIPFQVNGLCGNYNDNQMDDFQTPYGGIPEVSALLFGDSWKLQPYCSHTSKIRVRIFS